MGKLNIGVVYDPKRITEQEQKAAADGLRLFARFGVQSETIDVNDRKAISRVRRGESISGLISKEGEVPVYVSDLDHLGIGESLGILFGSGRRPVLGIGITPSRLIEISEDGRSPATGLGLFNVGALLSLSKIRLIRDESLAARTIMLATAHEMGHVLGRPDHCEEKCLMQANCNFDDFVSRFVRNALDFCRGCEARMSSAIQMIEGRF